eukprot:scaffold2552_cov380-Prasinococcus_capsulatus_cf.AAC.11
MTRGDVGSQVEDGVKYENGDNLIVLSRNRSSMRPPWRPHAASFDALKPQQVLVCGMKELPFMHDLCQELSHQLAPGSEVTIFAHGASALSPTLKVAVQCPVALARWHCGPMAATCHALDTAEPSWDGGFARGRRESRATRSSFKLWMASPGARNI